MVPTDEAFLLFPEKLTMEILLYDSQVEFAKRWCLFVLNKFFLHTITKTHIL